MGSIDEVLSRLREEFRVEAGRRIERAAGHLAVLKRRPESTDLLQELADIYHRLAGSGGTYGFPALSVEARETETAIAALLQRRTLPPAQLVIDWQQQLDRLRAELGQAGTSPPAPETLPSRILALSRRPALPLFEGLRGSTGGVTGDAETLDRWLAEGPAFALLIDLEVTGARTQIARLRRRGEARWPLLVAVTGGEQPLAERIELIRLGVDLSVSDREGFEPLVARLVERRRESAADEPWVFLHTLDLELRQALEGDLQTLGLRVETVTSTDAMLEAWLAHRPALLLLDETTTDRDALEICRTLREHPELDAPALVLLTSRSDPSSRQALFDAGIDDYLLLPYVQAEMHIRVRSLLGRRRGPDGRSSARTGAEEPAADDRPAGADRSAPDAAPGASPRVLVSDDDPMVRRLLAHHLTRQGWEVVLAEDGEQAEALLREEVFDAAVLDVMMPFRSGFELLRWLDEHPERRPERILLLTAQSQDENAMRAFDLGADDFVSKPFNPDVLVRRLGARPASP